VGEKLVATFGEELIAAFGGTVEATPLAVVTLASGLNEAERREFDARFAQYFKEKAKLMADRNLSMEARRTALAELTAARDAWVKEHLTPERQQQADAAQLAFQRANAEHTASRAVSRLSLAVDLTDEEKDKLYPAFLQRAQEAAFVPVPVDQALKFSLWGASYDAPSAPSLVDEAKEILTPEQYAYWDQQRQVPGQQNATMLQHLKDMGPSLIATIQELLEEK
jgi:hypothetical protein